MGEEVTLREPICIEKGGTSIEMTTSTAPEAAPYHTPFADEDRPHLAFLGHLCSQQLEGKAHVMLIDTQLERKPLLIAKYPELMLVALSHQLMRCSGKILSVLSHDQVSHSAVTDAEENWRAAKSLLVDLHAVLPDKAFSLLHAIMLKIDLDAGDLDAARELSLQLFSAGRAVQNEILTVTNFLTQRVGTLRIAANDRYPYF